MTYKDRPLQAQACLAALGIFLLASASCEQGYQGDTAAQPPGDTAAPTTPPATANAPSGGNGTSTTATHADATAPADAGADGGATTAATWTQIYTTMLANPAYPSNCAGGSCHNPGKSKGIDLSSASSGYRTLSAKVVPGSPATSTLFLLLQSGTMPAGRPHMSAQDLDLVRAWIAAGALDN